MDSATYLTSTSPWYTSTRRMANLPVQDNQCDGARDLQANLQKRGNALWMGYSSSRRIKFHICMVNHLKADVAMLRWRSVVI